jgi:hypothetical protein
MRPANDNGVHREVENDKTFVKKNERNKNNKKITLKRTKIVDI